MDSLIMINARLIFVKFVSNNQIFKPKKKKCNNSKWRTYFSETFPGTTEIKFKRYYGMRRLSDN